MSSNPNPSKINSFRDLNVWHSAMKLVETVYRLTELFPAKEAYGLTSQLRRASVSVPSNIAEGHAREHLREYLHHLSIAQASLAEVDTQIEIGLRLGYLSQETFDAHRTHLDSLGRQLRALRQSLSSKIAQSQKPNP